MSRQRVTGRDFCAALIDCMGAITLIGVLLLFMVAIAPSAVLS